jgi:GTP cyclohydrolase II
VLEDTREKRHEWVENKLMQQIKNDNLTAIIFYLKTQGKHLGYVERQELQHDGKLEIEYVNDWRHAKEED